MRNLSLCFAALLLQVAACGCSRQQPTAPSRPTPQVQVATPLQKEVVEWAEFTGRLEAVNYVEVRSRVSGYLASLHFEDGQMVEKGDLLFVIDPRPFEASLEKSKAGLVEARARAEQANAQLATAKADKDAANSTFDFANRQYERNKKLRTSQAVSESEVDRTRSEYLKAQAQMSAADAAIAAAESGISTATAAIETAKAAVSEAELNLSYTKVTTPVTGRVSRKNVTEGNLISGGSEQSVVLTTIVSTDPVYFVFDASEQRVLRFQRLTLEGARKSARDVRYPVYLGLVDEEGFPHTGYIDFVDNRFDPNTATMTARAVFENPNGILTPGLFGKMRLAETIPFQGLLVPDSAISADQSDQLVYVVNAESKVEPRRVETGSLAFGLRIIRSGITADDRVVVSGLQRVRPGMVVEPQTSEIIAGESGLSVQDALPAGTPRSTTQSVDENSSSDASDQVEVE